MLLRRMNFFVRKYKETKIMNSTPKPNLPSDIKPEEKNKAGSPDQPANKPEADAKKAV